MKRRILSFVLIFVLAGMTGCLQNSEPENCYVPTAEELRWINEIRVTVVKFHERWEQMEVRYW